MFASTPHHFSALSRPIGCLLADCALSIFGSTGLGFILQNRLKAAYLEVGLLQRSFANADLAVFTLNGLLSEPVKKSFLPFCLWLT